MYFGLLCLLGTAWGLSAPPLLWFPTACLFVPLLFSEKGQRWVLIGLILLLSIFCATKVRVRLPPPHGGEGQAVVKVHSVTPTHGHSKNMMVRGELKGLWRGKHCLAWGNPVSAVTKNLVPGRTYCVWGTVYPGTGYYSYLETSRQAEWIPLTSSQGIYPMRERCRRTVRQYIKEHLAPSETQELLGGMLLGDCTDPFIAYEFQRVGLAHLLAVSGFHFSLLAVILGCFFRRCFPKRWSPVALLGAMSTYFFLVGATPSVLRAWLAVTLALTAQVLYRRAEGPNSLGVALLAVLILDPTALYHIGFQLSFLATSALLLLFPLCDLGLRRLLAGKGMAFALKLRGWQQHQYMLLTYLRRLSALSLSIHLLTAPLLFHHFGGFPLLGLLYNLFIPPLLSVSLFLFILGVVTSPVPALSQLLHALNSRYTTFVNQLIMDTPDRLSISWTWSDWSPVTTIIFLSLAFFLLIPASIGCHNAKALPGAYGKW